MIVLSNRIGVLVHRFPNNRRPSICKDCRVTVSRIDLIACILSLVAHNISSYITMLHNLMIILSLYVIVMIHIYMPVYIYIYIYVYNMSM